MFIQFAKPTEFNVNQVVAIDDESIQVVVHVLEPWKMERFELRVIPLTSLANVDFVAESRVERIRGSLKLFLCCGFLGVLLIAKLRTGELMGGPLEWFLAPMGVLFAVPFCFGRLGVNGYFFHMGAKYSLHFSRANWALHGPDVLDALQHTNVRFRLYTCVDPRQPDV